MRITITETTNSAHLTEDLNFECDHANISIERACCSGYDSEGNLDCGCAGRDSVYCYDCKNEDMDDWTAEQLLKREDDYEA